MNESMFDNIIQLPNAEIQTKARTLVGFESRFQRVYANLKLLIDKEGLSAWEKKYYPHGLPIVSHITDKYPLVIFEGDVGTGKTVMAEGIADRVIRDLKKEGFLLRLSTRVRGAGLHGEMGNLVNDTFDRLKREAGKKRIAFLLIDEADAIAATRGTHQMHQEEKAGVNTIIQKIDELRELKGRAVIIMSTNRLRFLDEAIIRRAAVIINFRRPNSEERTELISMDFNGAELSNEQINEITQLTGPKFNEGVGFSFSDLRLRLFPEVVAKSYPDKPVLFKTIIETIKELQPSPEIK